MLYFMYRGKLDCVGGVLFSSYLIVFMIFLVVVICIVLVIMCVSMRGMICNFGLWKFMFKLFYICLVFFFLEMVWVFLGVVWVVDGVQCDRIVVNGIIVIVVVSWIIIVVMVVFIIIVFDFLGGKMVLYFFVGFSYLDSYDLSQLFNGFKMVVISVWEIRIKFLCCCIGKDDYIWVVFLSMVEFFLIYFLDIDLVFSDIVVGFVLFYQ